MKHLVLVFATVTLLPVPLLATGAFWGGLWIWGGVFYLTALAGVLDAILSLRLRPNVQEIAAFKADRLSAALAILHFFLLILGVWAISSNSGLTVLDRVGAFFAFGLYFGQVSNANAHELIHRTSPRLFLLGSWVYISLLFGHHTSAHRRIHHRYVATPDDPNSARRGESFYRFVPRAWFGSFRAGYEAERALLKVKRRNFTRLAHPYVTYVAGGFCCLVLAWFIGGLRGVMALSALAFYAQMQILLTDYVQHYGLVRRTLSSGKPEPLTDYHSWDAPHWFSGLMTLNAPRHSDHHASPAKPFPALKLPEGETSPTLPRSMPVMAVLALMPGRWRRRMDPIAIAWEDRARTAAIRRAVA
ncbi:MAG: alkane 1-monooxygenase [Halocynthiibacter sp.]